MPAERATLGLRAKLNSRSTVSRQTASTSGDPSARPCWIGASTCDWAFVATFSNVARSVIRSSGNPRGQINSSVNRRYTLSHGRAVATSAEQVSAHLP